MVEFNSRNEKEYPALLLEDVVHAYISMAYVHTSGEERERERERRPSVDN